MPDRPATLTVADVISLPTPTRTAPSSPCHTTFGRVIGSPWLGCSLSAAIWAHQTPRGRVASVEVLSANLRLRENLQTLSMRDPLTGLYNRRFMEEGLQREISRRRSEPA